MQAMRRAMRVIATDLAAVRGARTIFAGRSFSLAPGELLAVTGPNGSGKSTLLRVVAGLLSPAAGTVAVDPAGEGGIQASSAYLGHLDAMKPALTLGENLHFWNRLGGSARTVEAALDTVGLAHLVDLPAGSLSAGQRRRGAIARLLMTDRPLWLLDEPATSLDAASEATLAELVAAHLARGGMAIVAQHRSLSVPVSAELNLGTAA